MSKQLEGKVAVITGGGQGVGLGIAQELLDAGATVVLADRRRIDSTRRSLSSAERIEGIVADVSKRTEMEEMFERCMAGADG